MLIGTLSLAPAPGSKSSLPGQTGSQTTTSQNSAPTTFGSKSDAAKAAGTFDDAGFGSQLFTKSTRRLLSQGKPNPGMQPDVGFASTADHTNRKTGHSPVRPSR